MADNQQKALAVEFYGIASAIYNEKKDCTWIAFYNPQTQKTAKVYMAGRVEMNFPETPVRYTAEIQLPEVCFLSRGSSLRAVKSSVDAAK